MKIQFKKICSGIYDAKISSIIEKSGPYGAYWRFNFTIIEGELQGWCFYGIVKPYPVKQSKFYRWILHIMKGKPYENISINDLLGKKCRIIVDQKTKKNKTFYYVKDLADPF